MRSLILVVCMLSILVSGCASSDWTFKVSRSAYSNGFGGDIPIGSSGCPEADLFIASIFLAILMAPVVIDLVLLPITLTHDIVSRTHHAPSHGPPRYAVPPSHAPPSHATPSKSPKAMMRKKACEVGSIRNRNGKIRARGFRTSVAQ